MNARRHGLRTCEAERSQPKRPKQRRRLRKNGAAQPAEAAEAAQRNVLRASPKLFARSAQAAEVAKQRRERAADGVRRLAEVAKQREARPQAVPPHLQT